MPLQEPPAAAGATISLPSQPLAGRTLYRVWRHSGPDGNTRDEPWWFSSAKHDEPGGRFDLAEQAGGTCYLATSPVAAVLEALQDELTHVSTTVLRWRRRADVFTPDQAPDSADVTDQKCAGIGITAALWAGDDRALTRRWAAAFRRDGWWAIHAGVQHDPSGQLRAVALFDATAGEHPPSHPGEWTYAVHTLHDDMTLHAELADWGITVRDAGELNYADLDV